MQTAAGTKCDRRRFEAIRRYSMYNVIDYLENSVKVNGDKTAVIEEEKRVTYSELRDFSKSVGSYFIGQGVFNEPIVVFMDKGIDTLISFFGAVYAGCFYSLVNPEFPENRIEQIKNTINSGYVITDSVNAPLAKKCFAELTVLDITKLKKHKIDESGIAAVKEKHIDYDPLYVNFTSGSTGVPKGVVISHRSVIDFIDKFTEMFGFVSDDIIANQAPFDFDVSVKDIYSAIRVGATLVIVPKRYFSNPVALLDYLCDNSVTTLTWAVSALCLITTFHGLDYKVPSCVNKVIFSGEVMPLKHLGIWMKHLPDAMFVNVYGPTEITCNCTYHIIDRNRSYEDKIPIGKPFPNERVVLLDEAGKHISGKNEVGEICVIGTPLALGYYNNKEQTEKAFTADVNQTNFPQTVYHTGDLGYYNAEGELVFGGRKDFQIKYQGHRIELEEIDKAMAQCEGVSRSCAIFEPVKEKLYGFYIGDITRQELRQKLKEVLPEYMIPSPLIKKDDFPITKNGKIDRKKLLEEK